jgi:phosphoglycerol transferase
MITETDTGMGAGRYSVIRSASADLGGGGHPLGSAAVTEAEQVDAADAVEPSAASPGAAEDRSERIFPVGWRRMAAEGLLAATVAWVWAAFEYRVWDLSPRVPMNSTDDGRLITNMVKNIADEGWWTTNPDLGYPGGQQLYDFPHWGETWQMVILRAMSVFTGSPGLLMNAYFLIGVGVTGLAAYLALRHLRFGVGPALIASCALTWLPFRIGHGQYHLFRTSFWWVPLAFVLVLWVLHWRERFLIEPDPPARESWWRGIVWNLRHNLRRRRVLVGLVMVLVLAGSETMTTAFTLTLLAVTAVIAAVRRRDPATLLAHGLAIAAIGVVLLVLFSPTLRFVHSNGSNELAGRREVTEQERYGLKISSIVLPDPSHRWPLLGKPAARIREDTPVFSEGGMTIGLLGTAGFVGAIGHALTSGWGARRRDRRPPYDRDALRDDIGLLVVLCTLIATISGGAILLSLAGFSQVRVWNRISLLIAFGSLAYALTWLEKGWRVLRARLDARPARDRVWLRSAAGAVLVSALVGFVWWDGSTVTVDHRASDARWEADRAWVETLDAATPDGTAVFQFPVMLFPESQAIGQVRDYDHLRGWVHARPGAFVWSYGAIKGRDGDWQLIVRDQLGEAGSLPALIGLGFTGVWVDTFAYEDGGARVRAEVGDATGVDPIVSADGRTLYYDLRPMRDRLADEGTSKAELQDLARTQLGIEPGDAG